jgi:hypothetical protein
MNPAVAAALLSRTTPAKKPEPLPKPAVGPDLVAAAGGPEALQELVRKEKLRRQQQASAAAPEPPPARIPEPPALEELRASMPVEALASSLAAMARAQVRLPRPRKAKPKPVVFRPTAPAIVAKRVALALEALDGLELVITKGVTCHQRRWANKVGYALGAARRELERARALAEADGPGHSTLTNFRGNHEAGDGRSPGTAHELHQLSPGARRTGQ